MHLDQVFQLIVRLLRCEKLLRRSIVTLPNQERQESGFVAYWWRIDGAGGQELLTAASVYIPQPKCQAPDGLIKL